MTLDEMDLSELPQHFAFVKLIDAEFVRWEVYQPTTIEADVPFLDHWWKYVHWMPKIKNEFYKVALSSHNMQDDIFNLCNKYGMDHWFFNKHYREFRKRLDWMRKNSGTNHLGETRG